MLQLMSDNGIFNFVYRMIADRISVLNLTFQRSVKYKKAAKSNLSRFFLSTSKNT